MNIRKQLQELGKELLTLAALQSELEGRVKASQRRISKLMEAYEATIQEAYENEHNS